MPASRAAGKSAGAFRTISEVSDELDVPQHVLRFWEGKFSQVRPLKRGGGRRYYRPEDIDLLRRIRNLLYSEGYTIKGVQRLLREGRGKDDEAVVDGTPQAVDSDGDAGSELKAVIAELSELRDMLKKAGKG
jgi:DNA-binding transcriptional MerR regulator